MLIFLILVIFSHNLIADQFSKFMILEAKNCKLVDEGASSSSSSSVDNTKKIKNKKNKKNESNYQAKKETARVIGSIAQIVNDPRDSDNVLSAILNIISIFFRYIQHIENDHGFDHRSIGSNAEMELIVTACFDLLNKLNLPDDEKCLIINEVRSKIVELNEYNICRHENDQVEFLQSC